MKKVIAMWLVFVMAVGLAGCGGSGAPAQDASSAGEETAAAVSETKEESAGAVEAASEAAEPAATSEAAAEAVDLAAQPDNSVTISIQLALSNFALEFDQIVEAYKKDHPWIKDIEYNFPASAANEDLLVAALSAGELPDIITTAYGASFAQWFPYCVDMSDTYAYTQMTDAQIANGTIDPYGTIVMPIYEEGTGILYNLRLLEEAGWDHTPQTRDELLQLCKDLTDAGITPFMHQWAEVYLNLYLWTGGTWTGAKENGGVDLINSMLAGEDADLANDPDWNAFLDTYEQILIPYAQENAIATDKWTCRNAFFMEECAMLVGEGSFEVPNILNTNPDLLNYVEQSYLPIYNEPEKNRLQTDTMCASVTDSGDPVRTAAAKDFLSWFISSEEAGKWHQEVMGSPTSIVTLPTSEKLPCLAVDVIDLMQKGQNCQAIYVYIPSVLSTDLGNCWARFVAGQDDRETFTKAYEEVFKNYADGFYTG